MDQENQPVQGALSKIQQNNQSFVNPSIQSTLLAMKKKMQQYEDASPNQAAISQAMGMLNDKSPMGQVGKAIQSPEYAGYCQQFIDDKIGATQRYPTAATTWQAKIQSGQAQTDVSKAQPGDVIEFQPDQTNGNLGHAAIVTKNGDLQMATSNGIQTFSLKDWIKYSSQTPLGYYTPSQQGK